MYKKISGDYISLTQKERCLKSTLQNLSFLKGTQFWCSLTVATPLGIYWGLSFVLNLSDQICTFVLHDFAWYSCLFVYLCLMGCCIILWCMIFCCLFWLLKSFANCHTVCHPNNNVCTPFQQFCGGSNHGSHVFIRFGYLVANSPTHSPKSLDHFLLIVMDKPCRSNQRSVHYITIWEV